MKTSEQLGRNEGRGRWKSVLIFLLVLFFLYSLWNYSIPYTGLENGTALKVIFGVFVINLTYQLWKKKTQTQNKSKVGSFESISDNGKRYGSQTGAEVVHEKSYEETFSRKQDYSLTEKSKNTETSMTKDIEKEDGKDRVIVKSLASLPDSNLPDVPKSEYAFQLRDTNQGKGNQSTDNDLSITSFCENEFVVKDTIYNTKETSPDFWNGGDNLCTLEIKKDDESPGRPNMSESSSAFKGTHIQRSTGKSLLEARSEKLEEVSRAKEKEKNAGHKQSGLDILNENWGKFSSSLTETKSPHSSSYVKLFEENEQVQPVLSSRNIRLRREKGSEKLLELDEKGKAEGENLEKNEMEKREMENLKRENKKATRKLADLEEKLLEIKKERENIEIIEREREKEREKIRMMEREREKVRENLRMLERKREKEREKKEKEKERAKEREKEKERKENERKLEEELKESKNRKRVAVYC